VTRLCFVCMGNICRSPTAEAVMVHLLAQSELADRVVVESAGTGGWHVGQSADSRARAEARRRGVAMEGAARQFKRGDFARFDLVVAMDSDNLSDLKRMAPDAAARDKVVLLRSFDPASGDDRNVPDPYYGGPEGFSTVFDMVDAACRGLLDHVRTLPSGK
jgi:protein-tyrosine phosphatase